MNNNTNDKDVSNTKSELRGCTANPWEPMYDRMKDETCRNEKERIASERLRAGASLYESMISSGLSKKEFDDFFQRLKHWEDTNMTSGYIS